MVEHDKPHLSYAIREFTNCLLSYHQLIGGKNPNWLSLTIRNMQTNCYTNPDGICRNVPVSVIGFTENPFFNGFHSTRYNLRIKDEPFSRSVLTLKLWNFYYDIL